MQVDRTNFVELAPRIIQSINECDFIAIDAEFSGLSTGDMKPIHGLDSFQERYDKMKNAAENFTLLQFGICCFKSAPENNTIIADPYTIWVYPSSSRGVDPRFQFQTSSIEFLSSCKFDFNRSLKDGVSYTYIEEYEKAIQELNQIGEEKQGLENIDVSSIRSKEAREAIEGALKAAGELMQKCAEGDMYSKKEQPYVVLKPCSSFVRRVIYQEMAKQFPMIHIGKFPEDNEGFSNDSLRLTYCCDSEAVACTESRRLEIIRKQEIQRATLSYGVGLLCRSLINAKKPVIGHNCFLDLAHTVSKFIQPLPETVEKFRAVLQEALPFIVDTKYMFTSESALNAKIASNSSLESCYRVSRDPKFVENAPSIVLEDHQSNSYLNDEIFHEAGYDAYITGLVFLKGCLLIGIPMTRESLVQDIVRRAICNRLYLMRQDHAFILDTQVVERDMSHVVKLYNFPPITKTYHLSNLIKHYIPGMSWVRIAWENDTCAYFEAPSQSLAQYLVQVNHEMRQSRQGTKQKSFSEKNTLTMADVDISLFIENKSESKKRRLSMVSLASWLQPEKRQRNENETELKKDGKKDGNCILS